MKPRKSILRLLVPVMIVLFLCACIALMVVSRQPGQTATPMPTPMPTRIPLPEKIPPPVQGWEGVTLENVCLETSYSFPQIEGEFPQPIDESVELVLARLGMEIVEDATSCDATLALNLSGRAIAEFYWPGGKCFTGGNADGAVSLNAEGHPPLVFLVNGSDPPPDAISVRHCNSHRDPVDYSFRQVLIEAVLDGLVQLWGPQALVWAMEIDNIAYTMLLDVGPEDDVLTALFHALEKEDWEGSYQAIRLLGEFAPEAKEAIPFLIQILNDDQDYVAHWEAVNALRKFEQEAKDAIPTLIQAIKNEEAWALDPWGAAAALKWITGQDFGDDADLWEDWWQEQGN